MLRYLKMYPCSICGDRFWTYAALWTHYRVDHADLPWGTK